MDNAEAVAVVDNAEAVAAVPSMLHLERKHGPKKHWKKISVSAHKKKSELKLGSDLPYDGKIFVWFTSHAVVLQPSFKITVKGNTVHPYEEVPIPRMSGQHNLIICGVKYGVRVS